MKSAFLSLTVGTVLLASAAGQSCPITSAEFDSFDFSNVLSYCGMLLFRKVPM